ncbi:MAG: hypothetical protein ACT4O3_07195 [Elusimicrobiota bacterium]
MRRMAYRLIPVLLLAAVAFKGLHSHDVHSGGLTAAHVDCAVCAWAPGGHAPAAASGSVLPKNTSIHSARAAAGFPSFSSSPLSSVSSRAPPASLR